MIIVAKTPTDLYSTDGRIWVVLSAYPIQP